MLSDLAIFEIDLLSTEREILEQFRTALHRMKERLLQMDLDVFVVVDTAIQSMQKLKERAQAIHANPKVLSTLEEGIKRLSDKREELFK